MFPWVLTFIFIVAEVLAFTAHALAHLLTLLAGVRRLRAWLRLRRRKRKRAELD